MSHDPGEVVDAGLYGLVRSVDGEAAAGRVPIERVVTEFVDRLRVGENPTLDEYVERYPQLAGEVRELFPIVAAMEQWKTQKDLAPAGRHLPETIDIERLGDFRIIREIGRGGMGVVLEAEQESLGRRVAIKLLPQEFGKNARWRQRFQREARIAARLRHTHIVPVFSFGEHEGFCYYVMPFIMGVGLDWVIDRLREREGFVYADEVRASHNRDGPERDGQENGEREAANAASSAAREHAPADPGSSQRRLTRRSWKGFAKIGIQAASALRYAHKEGLLHRDIKPANLLLDDQGVVWITDFGLAKPIDQITDDLSIAGTLRYMAPEQLAGSADERSDVYALGLTLYELTTREPAFPARSRSELIRAVTEGVITPPARVNPRIPRDLEQIILRATRPDPRERYESADALLTDLLRFVNDQSLTSRRRGWLRGR